MVLRRTGVRKEQAQEQEQEKHGQQEVSERRYYQQEQHDDNNDRQRMITMGIIPYVAKAGSQVVVDCPITNLSAAESGKPRRRKCWKTNREKETVYLELNVKTLVSYVRIDNLSTSRVAVYGALHDDPHTFLPLHAPVLLPHHKATSLPLGHLPCTRLRIDCLVGAPIAIHRLTVRGVPTASVRFTVGNRFERLVVKLPQRLLFGPSLAAISGPYVRPGMTGIVSIDERGVDRSSSRGTEAELDDLLGTSEETRGVSKSSGCEAEVEMGGEGGIGVGSVSSEMAKREFGSHSWPPLHGQRSPIEGEELGAGEEAEDTSGLLSV